MDDSTSIAELTADAVVALRAMRAAEAEHNAAHAKWEWNMTDGTSAMRTFTLRALLRAERTFATAAADLAAATIADAR